MDASECAAALHGFKEPVHRCFPSTSGKEFGRQKIRLVILLHLINTSLHALPDRFREKPDNLFIVSGDRVKAPHA